MRLYHDDIVVLVGGETIALRASLRAAVSLTEKYGDFAPVVNGLRNEELGIVAAVISAASTDKTSVPELLECLSGATLRQLLDTLIPAAAEIVNRLLDLDEPSPKVRAASSRRVSLAVFYKSLFEGASGNLGWPPSEAWNATPQEILAALKGRNSLLRAIFGGEEPDEGSDERDIDALQTLSNLARSGTKLSQPEARAA